MAMAFVFPGQGSQQAGMGRDVYESSPAARAVFDAAERALGIPLARLCFEGPEEALRATENTQPALLATSIALLAAAAGGEEEVASLVRRHARYVAGHSLGEYTAAVAAGAIDLPTALRLVRRRGELMAAASAGAMAAVIGMPEEALAALCAEHATGTEPVVVANFNAPGQLVVSGAAEAVGRVVEDARGRGARGAFPLNVGGAFHSPLMAPSAREMAAVLARTEIGDAGVPLVANVTGEPLSAAFEIRAELAAQMVAGVRWMDGVRHMAGDGVDTFVEIGPGQVLKGMIRRIVPEARVISVSDLAGVERLREELEALAAPTAGQR